MADNDSNQRPGGVVRRRGGKPAIPVGFRPAPSDEELETTVLERWQGWGLLLTVLLAVFLPLYVVLFEPVRIKAAALEQRRESIERGAAHFALSSEENQAGFGCAQCHGTRAEGGVAPFRPPGSDPKADPVDYKAPDLKTVFKRQIVDGKKTAKEAYQFVFETISKGRPGTPMPPWGLAYGGGLNDQQIEDVVNYLISIQEGLPENTKLAVTAAEAEGPFSRLLAFASEIS